MRERGREAEREGGGSSAESSTFPQSGDLTHGSHTFLSPAADHAPALREKRETDREEGSTPGACKQYRVMEGRECVSLSAGLHVPPQVCFNMCLPPAPALNPFTAGSSDCQQTQDSHLFYGPTPAVVLSPLSAKVQTQQ